MSNSKTENQLASTMYIPQHSAPVIPPPESCHGLEEKELTVLKILSTVPKPHLMGHDEIIEFGAFSVGGNYWYWDIERLRRAPLTHLSKALKILTA